MPALGAFLFQKAIADNGTHEFNVDQKKVDQGKGGGLEGNFIVVGEDADYDSGSVQIQALIGADFWIDLIATAATTKATGEILNRIGPVNASRFRYVVTGVAGAAADLKVFFYSSQPIIDLTD